MPPKASGDAPKVPLLAPRVVVRVRPLAVEGGHSAQGRAVYKRLAKWGDGEVVLDDNVDLVRSGEAAKAADKLSRPQVYKFMQDILDTDAAQQAVYDSSTSEVVRKFVAEGYNALVFAYGQTGTGKTHTIFGPEQSWDNLRHNDAGIFPRAVADVFDAMAGQSYILSAAAMEFYMCECTDLMDDNRPCMIGIDHAPLGLRETEFRREEDCLEFMATVRANRTARSTLMNQAGGGHSGSSRSHCAMILTLRQVVSCDQCLKTKLTIMDMAGAERPSSTGQEHESAIKAVMDYWRGVPVSVGGQGVIVNFELSGLRTAVVQAAEQHRARRKLINPKSMGTSFIEFASGCFDGSSLLAMIVTLSPAPSCGWETWFSCKYGEDLAKLRAPVQAQRARPLDKVVDEAQKAVEKSRAELEKTPATGPASKYKFKREVTARHDQNEAEMWARLGGP